MASEKFCLRWNDFEKNISSAFRELRGDKDFFDVTLACGNEQIHAHKVILSACSSFFHNILRRNPHQHPLLYLKGVKISDLQSVLNFMYHGEVNVAQDELNSFLAVAEDLEVKGLTQNSTGTNNKKPERNPLPDNNPVVQRTPPAPKNIFREPSPSIESHHQATTNSQIDTNSYMRQTDVDEITVRVKAEPRDHAAPPSYQPSVQKSEPSYQSNHQLTPTDQQTVEYHDESFEDYGQYEENQVFEGSMGQAANGTKVFVTHDKIASYIQEQCLYQTDTTGAKIWSCGVCQKYLNHKRDLMRHIESFHIDTTPYLCTHCEAQFNTKRSVQRHTLAVHNTTYTQ